MKVSVIVPVYNAATYIENTLNDLESQDFESAEFILVNDGSKDESYELMKKYVQNSLDKRFKLYSKPNSGVSATRNFGLSKSQGTYVIFLDADDRFPKNLVSEYVNTIINDGTDFSFFGAVKVDEAGEVLGSLSYAKLDTGKIYTTADLFTFFGTQNLFGYPFLYISKKELWSSDSFDSEIKYQEDVEALAKVFSKNAKIKAKFHNREIYRYSQNPTSALHGMELADYDQFVLVADRVIQYAKVLVSDSQLKFVRGLRVTALLTVLNIAAVEKNDSVFQTYRDVLLEMTDEVSFDGVSKRTKRFIQYLLVRFNMQFVLRKVYTHVYE